LLINSKFSQNQLHYFDPQFPNTLGFLDQHYSQREYYQSAALAFHIKPNWEIAYSTDFALNNMNSDAGAFKYPTRITLLNVLASNLVLGNFTLEGSLLNTNISEIVKFGTASPGINKFSPTLMATIKPFSNKSLRLRAFYKSIFRGPTFNEQYYGFTSNPGLKPETADEYDLGMSYSKATSGLFDFISFTTDAYYNKVSNKIVYSPSLTIGPSQNYGQVDIKGLDAGIKTQAKFAGYRVPISVNYSYQQALDVTDPAMNPTYLNQLPYIPQNTLALNAGINKGNLGLYYNQLLLSRRYFNNNNDADDTLPAYEVSDASIVYKGVWLHFPIILSAEVNNIFNKSYTVVRSYPMPGRSYRFSFQITI
jgi:outer membrane receptor protein involved in Fe transport